MRTQSLRDVALRWAVGDFVLVRSRIVLYVWLAAAAMSLAYAYVLVRDMTRPLRTAAPPPPLPPDSGDIRFGLHLEVRKQIFAELAAAEPNARVEGKKSFPGPELEWSAEDHRGAFERKTAASIAATRHLSLTQVYLCLDEGIREQWPGPDGQPLSPKVVPLHPRRKYGW
jgi:hypothetical protein